MLEKWRPVLARPRNAASARRETLLEKPRRQALLWNYDLMSSQGANCGLISCLVGLVLHMQVVQDEAEDRARMRPEVAAN
jgi:hypothetical protein